jgi:hypothetical protein
MQSQLQETLQSKLEALWALLQVIHPFVKEVAFHLAACFW